MKIKVASRCDQGRDREENQDCLILDYNHHLYCVSDGMGGLPYGKVTAQIVSEQMLTYTQLLIDKEIDFDINNLELMIKKISTSIQQMGNVEGGNTLYGATLTGLLINDKKAFVMNVGDSRVYRYKDSKLVQLTKDQSLVQYWIDKGRFTKEQVKNHPMRNAILEFMGKAPHINPQIDEIKISNNETYCICSDGLFGMLEDEQIQDILNNNLSLEDKCHRLVDMANDAGGKDNISVILVEIKE